MPVTRLHTGVMPDGGNLGVVETTLEEYAGAFDLPASNTNAHLAGCGNWDEWSADWTGDVRSLDQATKRLTHGWADGAARVESLAAQIEIPPAQSRKRRHAWSDAGGHEVDVDRVMIGEPECWRTVRAQWVSGSPVVELWGRYGGSCTLTPEELFWSGAASIVACDVLEQAGYSVRLVGCRLSKCDGEGYDVSLEKVTIKEAGEPLRTDIVASVLACGAVFRKHGFRLLLTSPARYGPGYGWSRPWGAYRDQIEAAGEITSSVVTVDQSLTRQDAIREVNKILAAVQARRAG